MPDAAGGWRCDASVVVIRGTPAATIPFPDARIPLSMDSTRLVLLIVFCGSLFLLGQRWVESVSPRPVVQAAANVEPGRAATPVPAAASVPQSGAATAAAPGGAPPAAQAAPTVGQQVEVETDLLRARIDTRGGDLVHLELLDHGDPEEPTRPLVLFTRSAEHTYLAQSGLIGPGLPNHTTAWTVVDAPRTLGAGEDTLTVRLRADAGAGPIDKLLTFKRGSYLIETRFLGAAP
ncbi:MAG: membrane protein insertase YidC, partial [Burkholderiales bacterium]|nr:membrane protein insertase YidC [Burkholderiales bacterium]